jgi:hypothetical protein
MGVNVCFSVLLPAILTLSPLLSGACVEARQTGSPAVTDPGGSILTLPPETGSPAPADVNTDYFHSSVNADGSLTIASIADGSILLDSSPQYRFANATVSSAVTISNHSFEFVDAEGKPEGWTVNRPYITASDNRSSEGYRSLLFSMTGADTGHRHAFSSLIPIRQDARYLITVDSYTENLTAGSCGVYVYSYETADGSGPGSLSSEVSTVYDFLILPRAEGSWETSQFEWFPPAPARSFQVLIYAHAGTIGHVFFDRVRVEERTQSYVTNGGNVTHSVTQQSGSTVIRAVDDTNPYARVTHEYTLAPHSPFVTYTATVLYKRDLEVLEERFDFTAGSAAGQVMTRDLRLVDIGSSETYWSDLFTPRVAHFDNGLSFLGFDSMESMRIRASDGEAQVSLFSDYDRNHPHQYRVRGTSGPVSWASRSLRRAADTYSVSVTFCVNSAEPVKSLVKTRQPYGYRASMTFTNHADDENLAALRAVAYGSESAAAADASEGVVGHGIGWTKSVFVSGATGYDLQNAASKSLTDELHARGVEIVGHSITPQTDSRGVMSAGLQTLSQYGSVNWIDHGVNGGIGNLEAIASRGAVKGDDNYIVDLFDDYGYRYAWSYIDLVTQDYSLNMLAPEQSWDVRPFLFYVNQVDDNTSDGDRIYLWSTLNTGKLPDRYYARSGIDSLIVERGVHISHEYLGGPDCEGHAWQVNTSTGEVEIVPAFEEDLAYIAEMREANLLWTPTMSQMGDYLVALSKVSITPVSSRSFIVHNGSGGTVLGLTLLAGDSIRSAAVDGRTLVSFSGNQLVLPPLANGQSAALTVDFGSRDASIPTIRSTDTGKGKVNELAAVWDVGNRKLLVTAEARDSAPRAFALHVPALAGKSIVVRDSGNGTVLASGNVTGTGDVSISVAVGSVRSFEIGEANSVPSFSDASLTGMVMSAGPLSPAFVPATLAYAAQVPYSVASVTVTPTAAQGSATVTVNGVPVVNGSPSAALPLGYGNNQITVAVLAQDRVTSRNYSIAVSRASPPSPPPLGGGGGSASSPAALPIAAPTPAPASMVYSDLSISTADATAGDAVSVSVNVINKGGTAGTDSVTLLVDGRGTESQSVTLGPGEKGVVTFTFSAFREGTYDISAGGLSMTLDVRPKPSQAPSVVPAMPQAPPAQPDPAPAVPPPAFTLKNLKVVTPVRLTDPVIVKVTVANAGGTAGTYEAALIVDGTVLDRNSVTLDPAAEQEIILQTVIGQAGVHQIEVGPLTGSVTLARPEGTAPVSLLLAAAGALAAFLAVGSLLLVRARRRA